MNFFCLRIFPIKIDSQNFNRFDRLHVNEQFSIIIDHWNNTTSKILRFNFFESESVVWTSEIMRPCLVMLSPDMENLFSVYVSSAIQQSVSLRRF